MALSTRLAIICCRRALSQIIANLVDNAIKYSPLRGPIMVWLRRRPKIEDREFIEVCVEAQGIGVPSDPQPRLFERRRSQTVIGPPSGLYFMALSTRLA